MRKLLQCEGRRTSCRLSGSLSAAALAVSLLAQGAAEAAEGPFDCEITGSGAGVSLTGRRSIHVHDLEKTKTSGSDSILALELDGTDRMFTFDGTNRLTLARRGSGGGTQGLNMGQKAGAAGSLELDFRSGTTTIDFPAGSPGDTGLLVNRRASGRDGLYQGDVTLRVERDSTLVVRNETALTTAHPVSDAIEIEVQDRGTGSGWVPGMTGSQGASNIGITLDGSADISTSNGAGLYLAQGGTGDIRATLSEGVSIRTNGSSNPGRDSLNNHGLNAVVASGGTGSVDIDSAADFTVNGAETSAVFVFGDSAGISVATHQDLHDGRIEVNGRDGTGIRTMASDGDTRIRNGKRIAVKGEAARGIHAAVDALPELTKVREPGRNAYFLNYSSGKAGNATGRIDIANEARIDVEGRGATGILAERLSPESGTLRPPAAGSRTVDVTNSGRLKLESTETAGILVLERQGGGVNVVNGGGMLLYDRNEASRGEETEDAPREDDYATTGSRGVDVEVSGEGGLTLVNSGDVSIYGLRDGDSNNAGIRARSESGSMEIRNSGVLFLTGRGNAAIDAQSGSGSVTVASSGVLNLDGTGRQARPGTLPAESSRETVRTTGIRVKTGAGGNATVRSDEPETVADGSASLRIAHSGAVGIDVGTEDGWIDISNTKNMALEGEGNTGIRAETVSGAIGIRNSGRIRIEGRNSRGIEAASTGDDATAGVTVTSHGQLLLADAGDPATEGASPRETGGSLLEELLATQKPVGILAASRAASVTVDSHGPSGVPSGTPSLQIRAKDGHGIRAASEKGEVTVSNDKEILLSRDGSTGIEAWSRDGSVSVRHAGGILAVGENGETGDFGVFGHSALARTTIVLDGSVGTAERSADLKWGVMASSRVGETEAFGNGTSDVTVGGSIFVDGAGSFGIGLRSLGGNAFRTLPGGPGTQTIAGRQGIFIESNDTARNAVALSAGTVLAPSSGNAVVLATRRTPDGGAAAPGSPGAGTTITNDGIIVGLIAQGRADASGSGENALPTTILNRGTWYLSPGTDALGLPSADNEFRLETLLGTSGRNRVVNSGALLLDGRFGAREQAVTWMKAGVSVFENSGLIDTSANRRAGDWLVITGSPAPSATHAAIRRASSDIRQAAYHHLPQTTPDPSLTGEFHPDGGVFRFDISLGSDQTGWSDVLIVDNVVRTEGSRPVTIEFINRRRQLPADEVKLDKGIEVVRVLGTRSDEGAFVLGNDLVIDGYQYFLERDAEDHDWYVRNWRQQEGSSVRHVDPSVSGVLAGARTAAGLFNMSLLDRRDATWNARGTGWVRIERNDGSFRMSSGRHGIDRTTNLVQAGSTLWRSDDGRRNAGVFGGGGEAKVDVLDRSTRLAAGTRIEGWHAGAYWTSLPDWENGESAPYADLWCYWAAFRNSLSSAKWSSSGWAASAEAGWSLKGPGGWVFEPHVQAVWTDMRSKDFRRGDDAFSGGRFSGLSTRAGIRIFGNPERDPESGAKISPMLELNWLRDLARGRVRIGENAFRDGGPGQARDAGEVKLGWQGSIGRNWETWAHFGWQWGEDHWRNREFQIGLSRSFD